MPPLLSRLKERKLVQWALAYAAGGWALLEAADVVGGQFHWPEWLLQAVTIVIGMGFLVLLVVAWYHGEKGHQRVSGPELLILTALLLVAAGLLSSLGPSGDAPETSPLRSVTPLGAARPSVAVLPFADLSADTDQDFFVEGLHEALITDLSSVASLRVISRTSVMRYAEEPTPVRDIARELDVDAVVESSVLRAGDSVRITTRLLDGVTDENLWTATYVHEVRDVLRLTSQVARSVAQQFALALTPLQDSLLAVTGSVDPAAYEAYLRGRYAINRLRWTEAERFFQRAVAIDPAFANAYGAMSAAQYAAAYFGNAPNVEYERAMNRARATAHRALELDDRASGANATLGFVRLYFDWDWTGAREAFRRALDLYPNDVGARHGFGDLLTVLGQGDEGLRQVELGRDSDPLSLMANGPVVGHLFFTRRFDEVLAEADRLSGVFGGVGVFAGFTGMSRWHLGHREEALDDLARGWPDDPELRRRVERARNEFGPQAAAEVIADYLAADADSPRADEVYVSIYYALAENTEQALSWLERAYELRRPNLLHATVHPAFDLLRADPRFQDLMRRIGLPVVR
jgi:TolB-like protein